MDMKDVMELRAKAQSLRATIHVGKNGVDERISDEVESQLKKTKLVKVKLLPSLDRDRRDVAEELSRATSSTVIEIRGNTVVLAKD